MFRFSVKLSVYVLWYGVVREYEVASYQFTPTFFTSHKRSKTSEACMHFTMCCGSFFFLRFLFFQFH